jgi:hypothetical protein
MSAFYRGGNNLTPRHFELRFDRATGLVKPERGVSVSTRPDGLDRFGGAYLLGELPDELRAIQVGRDPHHFEIVPVAPMALDRYTELLGQVPLSAV